MKIEQVTMYKIGNRLFETLDDAHQYFRECQLQELIKTELGTREFDYGEVAEFILKHHEEINSILTRSPYRPFGEGEQ